MDVTAPACEPQGCWTAFGRQSSIHKVHAPVCGVGVGKLSNTTAAQTGPHDRLAELNLYSVLISLVCLPRNYTKLFN